MVYFCVENNSVHVLRVVLQTAFANGFPVDKRPDIHLENAEHGAPLYRALALRRFECVKLLVAAGALEGLLHTHRTRYARRVWLDDAAAGPSTSPSFFSTLSQYVRDPLKRTEQKLKAFEFALHHSPSEIDDGVEVKVLKNEEEVVSAFWSDLDVVMSQTGMDPSSALTRFSNHQYDLQAALESHRDADTRTEFSESQDSLQCIVCFEKRSAKHFVKMPCGHATCNECWKGPTRLSEQV